PVNPIIEPSARSRILANPTSACRAAGDFLRMPRRSPPLHLQHGTLSSANCSPELAKLPVASTARSPPPPLQLAPLHQIQTSSGVTALGALAGERPCCGGAT
ncbi:unnamed protein product, partial [Urochloa humidicola]